VHAAAALSGCLPSPSDAAAKILRPCLLGLTDVGTILEARRGLAAVAGLCPRSVLLCESVPSVVDTLIAASVPEAGGDAESRVACVQVCWVRSKPCLSGALIIIGHAGSGTSMPYPRLPGIGPEYDGACVGVAQACKPRVYI
jgi:hypothetical protein